MVRLVRTVVETTSTEVHYHLMDIKISADKYMKLAGRHWGIENSLHWVLNIHFPEDASTENRGNAIPNLILLRKIAFNFTKLDPAMKILCYTILYNLLPLFFPYQGLYHPLRRYNTREALRETSLVINLVFSRVSRDFNNKI